LLEVVRVSFIGLLLFSDPSGPIPWPGLPITEGAAQGQVR